MTTRKSLIVALPLVAAFAGSSAFSQDISSMLANRKAFGLGAGLGWYLPSNGTIKSAFGKSVFKYGLDLGPGPHISNGKIGPSVSFLTASNGSNKLMALSGMIAFETRLTTQKNATFIPYAKVGAGLAYEDYTFNNAGTHYSGKQLVPTAELKLGVIFDRNWELYAAYDLYSSTRGFDPSGINISLSYTFLRF